MTSLSAQARSFITDSRRVESMTGKEQFIMRQNDESLGTDARFALENADLLRSGF
jgi:hypothetical protein